MGEPEMMGVPTARIPERARAILGELYGSDAARAEALLSAAISRSRDAPGKGTARRRSLPDFAFEGDPPTERDPLAGREALLIAYGDMLSGDSGDALARLSDFAKRRLGDCFGFMHLLPFFPSTSDGGFAVADYGCVDPKLGDWEDIARIASGFGLVFDLVLNHASSRGAWFAEFVANASARRGWFLVRPEGYDAGSVYRPRLSPLFTKFESPGGPLDVWTTFGPDQVDFDYSNPAVLAEFVAIALEYAERGASMLRLDAVAYLWKEKGHSCLHHRKTHLVVKLMRAMLDRYAPGTLILTETNVPHADNVSYFGAGDEAQMVYNFALPPLVLHSFIEGRSGALSSWAASLEPPPPGCAFLNFLASHDGIGLAPARGALTSGEIERLASTVRSRGGHVSERATAEGSEAYELNSTWLDAIADPDLSARRRAEICLASLAAMLSLAGLPAIYFHLLVGSPNWSSGAACSGSPRDLNRERPDISELEAELDSPSSLRASVFEGIRSLLRARSARRAFDASSVQLVLDPGGSGRPAVAGSRSEGALFAVLRGSGPTACLSAVNCGGARARCALPEGFSPRGEAFDPRSIETRGEVPALERASGHAPRIETPSAGGGEGFLEVPPFGTLWIDGSLEEASRCI